MNKIKNIVNVLSFVTVGLIFNEWFTFNFSEGFVSFVGFIMIVCIFWLCYLVNKKTQ